MYLPIDQDKNAGLSHPAADPVARRQPDPEIYRELARIGPSIAIGEIRTLRRQVDDSIFEQRILAAVGL